MPIKPKKIANKFVSLIFSPRKGNASIVAIIGAVCNRAWFSANNKYFNPKKNKTTQSTDENALIKWTIGFVVINLFQPKRKSSNIAIIVPLNALIKTIFI